ALSQGGKTLAWGGDNDQGQGVTGGTYYLKVEMEDPFGAKQSWSQSVTVLPPAPAQSLVIYNSAGEAVAHLSASSGMGKSFTGLALHDSSKGAYALGNGGVVDFDVADSSGALVPVHW